MNKKVMGFPLWGWALAAVMAGGIILYMRRRPDNTPVESTGGFPILVGTPTFDQMAEGIGGGGTSIGSGLGMSGGLPPELADFLVTLQNRIAGGDGAGAPALVGVGQAAPQGIGARFPGGRGNPFQHPAGSLPEYPGYGPTEGYGKRDFDQVLGMWIQRTDFDPRRPGFISGEGDHTGATADPYD